MAQVMPKHPVLLLQTHHALHSLFLLFLRHTEKLIFHQQLLAFI
jgi:hypothetical protein